MSHLRAHSIRLAFALAAIYGALMGPIWLPILAISISSLRFRAWEALFIGLAIDLLWMPGEGVLSHIPLFTLFALAAVWGLEPLRKQLLLFS